MTLHTLGHRHEMRSHWRASTEGCAPVPTGPPARASSTVGPRRGPLTRWSGSLQTRRRPGRTVGRGSCGWLPPRRAGDPRGARRRPGPGRRRVPRHRRRARGRGRGHPQLTPLLWSSSSPTGFPADSWGTGSALTVVGMTDTTAGRVRAIESRLAAATPDPWSEANYNSLTVVSAAEPDYASAGNIETCADQDLIANAPGDLAWLLEQLAASEVRAAAAEADVASTREELRIRRHSPACFGCDLCWAPCDECGQPREDWGRAATSTSATGPFPRTRTRPRRLSATARQTISRRHPSSPSGRSSTDAPRADLPPFTKPRLTFHETGSWLSR